MTNHVHLLLTARDEHGCGLLMKHIGQLQSQYANRTYHRTGSLWESRYRSCLVQSEGYLLSCYRYIELNPVRAQIVQFPADYPWSSYGTNAAGKPSGLITPHPEYLRLGATDGERLEAYRDLVERGLDTNSLMTIRSATNGGFALGDGEFTRRLAAACGRSVDKGKPGRRPTGSGTDRDQGKLV
jgi:putative transposase